MHLKQILDLIKNFVTAWVDDYVPSMGAAIACECDAAELEMK